MEDQPTRHTPVIPVRTTVSLASTFAAHSGAQATLRSLEKVVNAVRGTDTAAR